MKVYKFVVEMYARGESADDAAKRLTEELDYLFKADNECVAFIHPENGVEEKEV